MPVRFLLPLILLGLLPVCRFAFADEKSELRMIGDTLRSADPEEMLSFAERFDGSAELPDVATGLAVSAMVHAYASGDPQRIDRIIGELPSSVRKQLGDTDAFRVLAPRQLTLSAEDFSSSVPMMVNVFRDRVISATAIGNTERVHLQKERIENAELSPTLRAELIQFATDAEKLTTRIPSSPLKTAIDLSRAAEIGDVAESDRAYEKYVTYLQSGLRRRKFMTRTRGGIGTNQFDHLVAMAENQADVITAISTIHQNYWAGEIERGKAIEQIQQTLSNEMDLKKKRAALYWALKALKEEQTSKENEESKARNRERTEALRRRRSEDISAVWPTVFQHRDLRRDAAGLRQQIAQYSEENSGALSMCYAKCSLYLRRLHRTLRTELDGLTMNQQTMLRTYLREIEEELQESFDRNSNLYALAQRREPPSQPSGNDESASSELASMLASVKMPMSNNHRELASFALFQSMVGSMASAGKEGNRNELAVLAKMINESSLLIDEHKQALKSLGSQIYQGKISAARLQTIDDPISVLSQLAGIIESEPFRQSDVPEEVSEEAFNVLIAQTLDASR
ncbi:hypothetical protein [Rhodopirellula sallentina]|uniref:Secreted protein n=1 Tax=Rhodopirellula sallentina SM41 TaxID=1263870 RepID=M5UHQ1_9BACT|nr:hypothetical protein [Rhodopirellula sallentina]EMI57371.1 secreted protein [Rhodopirellula sallentina SM41]